MARTNVTPQGELHIGRVQDDLSDVNDGLARIRAIADLLQLSDSDDPLDSETVKGAAETVFCETASLRGVVIEAIKKLDAFKKQDVATGGSHLEVVRA